MRDLPKQIAARAEMIRGGKRVRIYLLERCSGAPKGISRVGGLPVGIEEWPRTPDGQPMEHILTVAARELPGTKNLHGAAGFAVFVSSADDNEAYEPDTSDSAVVLLDERALGRGAWKGAAPAQVLDAAAIEVVAVDLPEAVFDTDNEELEELRSLVFQAPGRVGGPPLWLQGDEYDGPMLVQFDEALVPMNLGDAGVMYVFPETAFWQCS